MITVTENGLLIEMRGEADDIQVLNQELIRVLQTASLSAEDRGMNYYMLFELLEAIAPTEEQLMAIHSMGG